MATTHAAAARGTVSARSGASRKLLSVKAAKSAADAPRPAVEALEASFPAGEQVLPKAASDVATAPAEGSAPETDDESSAQAASFSTHTMLAPESAPSAYAPPPAAPAPASAPEWSEADESAYQAMATRRAAAGYQRRGRDVGGQVLSVGGVAPNSGTVAATIVALVAERGTVARADLLTAMGAAAFPHAKARPADKGWCQGYVAGCVRDGFLALVAGAPAGESTADTDR